MTIPWPGGLERSVNGPDPSQQQVTQGLSAVVTQLRSLNQAVQTQTSMMQRASNASSRFSSPGSAGSGRGGGGSPAGQPHMRSDVTSAMKARGSSIGGGGPAMVSPMSAMSSMSSLKAFGAQQLGQWMAGMPLYESAQPSGAGGTPVGTPSSLNPPATGTGGNPGNTSAGSGGGSDDEYIGRHAGGYTGSHRAPASTAPVGSPGGGGTGYGPGGGGPGGGGGGGGGPAAPQPGGTGGGGGQGPGNTPQKLSTLQRVGVQVAASAGGPGSISSALKEIPGVGLAMDAANSVTSTYLNQREAGRVYQNVEGGSNLDAQTERLHAAAYEASMYGRMPGGAAAQAFGQVTAMGFTQAATNEGQEGQNRQSALNFAYHNYTATGMDVNESMSFLNSASQNSTVNLTQLSQALNDLSTAAGKAGTNAEQARASFQSYFNAALAGGAANGSTGLATGIAGMQAQMGKTMAGVNFSGLLSQQNQYLLSGQTGMSASQLQQIQRTNPGQYNQLLAGQSLSELKGSGLMSSSEQGDLQKMIQQAGGTAALKSNPDLANQIASQFLNKDQVSGNINENLWSQYISSMTGSSMNNNQAMQWIVDQFGGVNEASSNASVNKNMGASVSASKLGSAPTGKGGLAQGNQGNLLGRLTGGLFGHESQSWQQVLQGDNSSAANSYLSSESKSGQRNPVLESLIQNTQSGDQVSVQTATGTRVMSMSDAMKYYPNELESGNVNFYSSSGQSLGNTSALTGGLTNTGANTAGEQKQKAGSSLGVSLSAYQKAHPDSASGQLNGTFDLTTAAAQLLKLLPTTSNQAAATSTVPANTYASQASR